MSRPDLSEWMEGTRAIAPLVVAVVPIGFVFGAAAVTNGQSPLAVTLMSALLFAGDQQFVA